MTEPQPMRTTAWTGWIYRVAVMVLLMAGAGAHASEAAAPLSDPVLEEPTLHSLGVYWIIGGDDNRNAVVRLEYRKPDESAWHAAPVLLRVERGIHASGEQPGAPAVPDGAWLFAGSALFLEPDTAYQLQLTLEDADGGGAQRRLTARTIAEPTARPEAPVYRVTPGDGGGAGTVADPYRGLEAAQKRARPGDIFLLAPGIYDRPFVVNRSGEKDRPIIWRGEGEGRSAIRPAGDESGRAGRAIAAVGVHDVWFENLAIGNAEYGLVGHESARLVIRRCRFVDVAYAITATRNQTDAVRGFFIADNTIAGPSTWPRSKGIEDARGIQITGAGHVICHNRIEGFADAIDLFPSRRCESIDIHNNELSELTDDGIELDYSQRNTRCFSNRLTNVFQGISAQPVLGGPAYIVRNALYNVAVEPFKLHNGPSGVLIVHNTVVRSGEGFLLWSAKPIRNIYARNNLYASTGGGKYIAESTAPAVDCDLDFDGFAFAAPARQFLRWDKQRYATIEDVRAKAPIYRHALVVGLNGLFAEGTQPPEDAARQYAPVDLRLSAAGEAVDAGQPLPGFGLPWSGAAPDLGAYEVGAALPHYGPRPVK